MNRMPGLDDKSVAARLGVSAGYVRRARCGRGCSYGFAVRLAAVYGCEALEFISACRRGTATTKKPKRGRE